MRQARTCTPPRGLWPPACVPASTRKPSPNLLFSVSRLLCGRPETKLKKLRPNLSLNSNHNKPACDQKLTRKPMASHTGNSKVHERLHESSSVPRWKGSEDDIMAPSCERPTHACPLAPIILTSYAAAWARRSSSLHRPLESAGGCCVSYICGEDNTGENSMNVVPTRVFDTNVNKKDPASIVSFLLAAAGGRKCHTLWWVWLTSWTRARGRY